MWNFRFKNRQHQPIDSEPNQFFPDNGPVREKKRRNWGRSSAAVLSFALLTLVLTGCTQKGAGSQAIQEATNSQPDLSTLSDPLPPSEPIKNMPIAIKGFEINMSRRDAWNNLNRLGFSTVTTNTVSPGQIQDVAFIPAGGKIVLSFTGNPPTLKRLDMVDPMVDHLFNVNDLSLEDFSQEFTDEYHIPEMKPFSQGSVHGWKYNDEDSGYEIVVWSSRTYGKCITFRQVPTRGERKFD